MLGFCCYEEIPTLHSSGGPSGWCCSLVHGLQSVMAGQAWWSMSAHVVMTRGGGGKEKERDHVRGLSVFSFFIPSVPLTHGIVPLRAGHS